MEKKIIIKDDLKKQERFNEIAHVGYMGKKNEFDLEKLEKLTKKNDDAVTLEILKQCKI